MLDIRLIREKPDFVRERLATRGGGDEAVIDELLKVDVGVRKTQTELQRLYAERNRLSKEIGAKRTKGEVTTELVNQVNAIGSEINKLEQASLAEGNELREQQLLLEIPNLPHESVPIGKDPSANRVARSWGEKPKLAKPADHVALGTRLNLFNLDWATKLSGSGFICFTGAGAKLERALINFMLDLHTREHGYVEVAPPFLVRREVMAGTGQLPKFEDDLYRTMPDDLFLVPTAEVPVTNLHRDEILDGTTLPKGYVAYTPCFRREAGAAGKDTRGLLRVHQFDKVELVRFCLAADSPAVHANLPGHADAVRQQLELPYRVA